MPETKLLKAKNNESGTFGETLLYNTTSSVKVSPVPANAPGVIVAEIGTSAEEHIYYTTKDDVAGTISGLTRDYTNLNGGVGTEHLNGASWETAQASEYLNNIVDALEEGYIEEQNTVAYVSATQFTVNTDQTGIYTTGRIVRLNGSSATIGTVNTSTYNSGTGLTTVTVDSVTTPSPLTKVEFGIQPKNSADQTVLKNATQTMANKTLTAPVVTDIKTSGIHDNGNSGAAATIDANNGDRQKITLTANCTLTFANFVAGSFVKLYIDQDATGGWTLTLPTGKWPGGSAGTFTTTASAKDTLIIDYDGTDYMYQLAADWA